MCRIREKNLKNNKDKNNKKIHIIVFINVV